ncbi:hypothetical protein BY996DRAFT_6409092 [Phakopsora pachyrhizi]|nr:hypothetical protein BY996DRAFT_6409092 [Phakopsora pachyrhizi]
MSPPQGNPGSSRRDRMSRFGKSLSTLQIPSVSGISKRIHGMTWQAYLTYSHENSSNPVKKTRIAKPVGLGTATGYILLSALKPHPKFPILYPRQFRRVALDPNKNSFIPTSVLVFATLIVGLVNFATGAMTPAWAFPVFPLLLTGVVTFNVLKIIPLTDPRAVSIFITGLFMFGGGAFMCIFYLANGAFIAAGPPGFSAGSIFVGTMLTGCSAVLFILAAIPYWSRIHKHLNEVLGCWATTFPNIGLILSLRFLGDTFKSDLILAFQTVLTIMVFTVYLIVFVLTIMAVWKGLVLVSDDKAVYLDSLEIESPKDVEKGGHGAAGHGKH